MHGAGNLGRVGHLALGTWHCALDVWHTPLQPIDTHLLERVELPFRLLPALEQLSLVRADLIQVVAKGFSHVHLLSADVRRDGATFIL